MEVYQLELERVGGPPDSRAQYPPDRRLWLPRLVERWSVDLRRRWAAGKIRLLPGKDMNATLQALIESKPPGASPLAAPPKPPIQKLHYSHEAMIDQIIQNPAISGNELAQLFGYSASWISTIITSDLFQAKLEERRAELIDPELRLSIKTQMSGLLHRSLEVLRHKLSKPADEIPDQLALQTAKVMGQNLGHGNEVKVTLEQTHTHLHELGNNLVGLLRRQKAEVALEGEFSHVQADEGKPAA